MQLGSKKGAEDITRRKGSNKLKYEARFQKGAKELTLRKGPKTTKKTLNTGLRHKGLGPKKNGLRSFR